MDNQINLKKYRTLSLFGGALLGISLAFAIWQMINNSINFITLVGALTGWIIFSKYHALIAIHKLKQITHEYIQTVQNKT